MDNDNFKNIIQLHSIEFLKVEEKRILNVDENCNQLVFKGGVMGKIPKQDFGRIGALEGPELKNIQIFFIYHESHSDTCQNLHK